MANHKQRRKAPTIFAGAPSHLRCHQVPAAWHTRKPRLFPRTRTDDLPCPDLRKQSPSDPEAPILYRLEHDHLCGGGDRAWCRGGGAVADKDGWGRPEVEGYRQWGSNSALRGSPAATASSQHPKQNPQENPPLHEGGDKMAQLTMQYIRSLIAGRRRAPSRWRSWC